MKVCGQNQPRPVLSFKIYINALDGERKGDLRPHYWRETFPQMECGLKGDI